jgi:nucleotide-binding universal stress UspA family protein
MKETSMYANILVPIDGSRLSDKAVQHAVMLARAGGGKLLLFHVVAPYQMPVYVEGMKVPSLPRETALKASAKRAGPHPPRGGEEGRRGQGAGKQGMGNQRLSAPRHRRDRGQAPLRPDRHGLARAQRAFAAAARKRNPRGVSEGEGAGPRGALD